MMFTTTRQIIGLVAFVLIGIIAGFLVNKYLIPNMGATQIRPADIFGVYFFAIIAAVLGAYFLFGTKK